MLPLLVCAAFFALAGAYSIPDPEFHVLKPSGLKVSIPNEDGIEVFSFHGNVNQEMKGLESGQISQDASATQNDIPETEHILTIVKRHADSGEEEDKSDSSDVQLESRFGFSRGFGGANFIYPNRHSHKPYRAHGYRFHGHGYDDHRHDYDHGYGFYPGHHRPHGPPHRPYPVGPYPGFGKDHRKFDDYYDCEEDDSNENEKPSEPTNLETTTPAAKPMTKEPEVPGTEEPAITSPTTSTTTSTTTTTTTTTERTSTFPQIDIRFGES